MLVTLPTCPRFHTPHEPDSLTQPQPRVSHRLIHPFLFTALDLAGVFRIWDAKQTTPHYDPVPVLTRYVTLPHGGPCRISSDLETHTPFRLSELFEEESQIFMRKDPDPFDERHPSRTDPDCELGRMLKLLFRKDLFMTKVPIRISEAKLFSCPSSNPLGLPCLPCSS